MIINDNDIKIKVIATEQFKRCKKKPKELDHIPEPGEVFECTYNRARYLSGANVFKRAFVKVPRSGGVSLLASTPGIQQVNPIYDEDLSADDISFDVSPAVVPEIPEPVVVAQPKKRGRKKKVDGDQGQE